MTGFLVREEIWTRISTVERWCENREKTAIYKPRREASEEIIPANTLTSDF